MKVKLRHMDEIDGPVFAQCEPQELPQLVETLESIGLFADGEDFNHIWCQIVRKDDDVFGEIIYNNEE